MEMVQLIVECTLNPDRERMIKQFGTVKYTLPMINAYVIEVPKDKVAMLAGLDGIKQVDQTSKITAQMNVARKAVEADKAHHQGFNGRGVTIAILDTGISPVDDFTTPRNRILAFKDFVGGKKEAYDDNGHGTHVAGIAAGNGICSNGKYVGIAPESNLVAVKVLDEKGAGNSADVLAGIQWVIDNRERYSIRIANLSVGTVDILGRDPLVRAVEAAWDAGIVITAAAGNNGPNERSITSPGVSRKVITIGASDDNKSVQIWGDTLENYSGRGPTPDCIIKPDVIAPGANIVSCLTATLPAFKQNNDKTKIISPDYIQMSGTSMSTPIVAGAIALLLQKSPALTPNDVKLMLKKTANNLNYPQNQQGWGIINIDKLLMAPSVNLIENKPEKKETPYPKNAVEARYFKAMTFPPKDMRSLQTIKPFLPSAKPYAAAADNSIHEDGIYDIDHICLSDKSKYTMPNNLLAAMMLLNMIK